jgi:hypothetical protein
MCNKPLVDTGDFSWNTLIDMVIEWERTIKPLKEALHPPQKISL